MADFLSLAEMESRFAGEWVLIEDPQTDQTLKIQSGRVLSHSKNRDEVYRQAIVLRPRRSAFLYLGPMPEHTVLVLNASLPAGFGKVG
jgi:hypothetical protein